MVYFRYKLLSKALQTILYTMDLLGSILGKMDAPTSAPVDEETKKKVKDTVYNYRYFFSVHPVYCLCEKLDFMSVEFL